MARPKTYNKYQYETSPRKLEPDYDVQKPKYKKKSTALKNKPKQKAKTKFKTIVYVSLAFVILFAICYRNSQINESFSKIQKLKGDLAQIQKTNEQLNVNIQNSLNLNQVEQRARELLGMQKLTNKQTVYVNLPKKDYVEPAVEKVIIQPDEKGFFASISETLANIF